MLKCRRPLPLVRPEGGWSPPELDPLDGLALHAQEFEQHSLSIHLLLHCCQGLARTSRLAAGHVTA